MNDSHPEFTLEPLGRFEWERLVRRALIKPPSVKMLGLVMATYANSDGTRVRPGQKRLANVMGTSISTVERGQRALEALGFIEMTYKGHSAGRGRSGGYASEYRLTIPADLLERIPMLDPDENHPSPTPSESESHTAPMTGEYPPEASRECRESQETPVNPEEIPVTGAETPVDLAKTPVTHDGPPDHYHHIKDHNKYQSASPYVTREPARARRTADLIEDLSLEEERAKQMRGLQELQKRMDAEQKEAS